MANAGIASAGLVVNTDPAAWERVMEVNLFGVWRTVRTCLPHVIERKGYILPVASLASTAAQPRDVCVLGQQGGRGGFRRRPPRRGGAPRRARGLRVLLLDRHRHGGRWRRQRRGGILRAKMKGPLAKTYPLSVAIDAVEKGIENRSRRVMAPSWIKYLFAMRDFLGPITDRQVADVMAEVERVAVCGHRRAGAQSFRARWSRRRGGLAH